MKNIAYLILITSLFCGYAFADDQVKEGKAALERGDIQAAISLLRDATQKEKKNSEGFILLAQALLKADSLDQANAVLVQARELDPNNPSIYALLGDCYAKQRIWAAAIEQYEKATQLDSMNVTYFTKLGDADKKARKYTQAAQAWQKIQTLDSNNVSSLRELASLYFRAKQYPNAAEKLARLVRVAPDSLDYQIMYVKSLHELKRYEDLIPVAESILKKDGSLIDIQTILAEAYQKTGKTKLVIEQYKKMSPEAMKVEDFIRLAKALQADSQYSPAAEMFMKAYGKDSTRCDIPWDLGTLYMFKLKKYSEALSMFDKKIACDTSAGYRFASHLYAGMALMQMKKFKEAKDHIQESIKYRPDNVPAWQTLAECYGQMDQFTDEISAYKKVIEIATDPNSNSEEGKYNGQLCEAYRMIGVRYLIDASKEKEPVKEKYVLSLEYLKKALPCNPRDCALLLWVAQASQNSNNKDEARKYYHKVIDTCPNSKEAETAKAALLVLGEK